MTCIRAEAETCLTSAPVFRIISAFRLVAEFPAVDPGELKK
jgi:hypothetical protein